MRTPTQAAEEIKNKHGCALTRLASQSEMIDVPGVGDQITRQVPRSLLAEVVEPRIEELFMLIQAELRHSGFEEMLGAGVVLTGGSSRMEGITELAEEVFRMPVRLGIPKYVGGLGEVVRSPIYSTAIGLVLFAHQNRNGPKASQPRTTRMQHVMSSARDWLRARFGEGVS